MTQPPRGPVVRPLVEEAGPAPFEDFYRRHLDGLTRFAGALVGRTDVAEELVQDAFIGLGRSWDTVDAPYGYVRRSVINGAYDHLRKERRRRRFLARQRPELLSGGPEIDETLDRLATLSPRRQAALVLRFYEDLDYDEIASLLECENATARSLVHRGLEDLRKKLA